MELAPKVLCHVIRRYTCSKQKYAHQLLTFFQGILDIFKEGFARIFTGTGPRALPMWYLLPATVTFGLAHYIVSSSVKILG